MIGLIYGWRGVGKTVFVLSILIAVSKGEALGPWEDAHSVPCLLLDGEMPLQDIQKRLQELDSRENPKNRLFIYSDASASSVGYRRAHLADEAWRDEMKKYLLDKGVKLWAIDNLASLTGGLDENTKQDWDPFNAWLLELRFEGISTLMLHHESKTGRKRGTAAREDNIDISIRLKAPYDYTPEEGARFIAHFEKSRLSPDDLPLITDTEFRLEQDEHGLRWSFDKVKVENRRAVLQLIDQGLDQKSIHEVLNLSKGYVSKIVKGARAEGFISTANELTPAGHMEAFGQ